MIDMVMLLVALVSFAVLVVGWMVLPDASAVESMPVNAPVSAPIAVVEAA